MTVFAVENSAAFVTGVSKPNGIGRGIVEALIAHGAKKVYATARSASQLDDLVAAHNGKVVAVELDVTDVDAIKQLPSKYSDVNLLVNNAGLALPISVLGDVTMAYKEMSTNYFAILEMVNAFAPILAQATLDESSEKASAVVNINSLNSFINFAPLSTYSASKAASHSLTIAQRRELSGSLVVGVYPGLIDTVMAENVPYHKTPPRDVGERIVEALTDGTEELFPDATGIQMMEMFRADPAGTQKKF